MRYEGVNGGYRETHNEDMPVFQHRPTPVCQQPEVFKGRMQVSEGSNPQVNNPPLLTARESQMDPSLQIREARAQIELGLGEHLPQFGHKPSMLLSGGTNAFRDHHWQKSVEGS